MEEDTMGFEEKGEFLFPMVPEEARAENDKTYLDWVRHPFYGAVLLPCLLVIVFFYRYEGAWLSMFFSRGIYFILACIIFGCFVINFFKTKMEVRAVAADPQNDQLTWCTPATIWKSPFMASPGDLTRKVEEACGSDTVKQLLREADTRNEALKRELEELNKARLALEERSGQLEREKIKAEEILEESKFQSSLENEGLRKEAAIAQRQLQQILEEKEMLSREVSSVSREARITDSALRDQARLTTRLEEARSELKRLKQQMEDMKVERDTAVAIAADLAVRAQGAADDSAQLIGHWVKREMENRRKKNGQPSMIAMVTADPQSEAASEPEVCHILQEIQQKDRVKENSPEASGSQNFLQTEVIFKPTSLIGDDEKPKEVAEPNLLDNNLKSMLNWKNEEPEGLKVLGCGLVTSSPAFRDFLASSYSQMPL